MLLYKQVGPWNLWAAYAHLPQGNTGLWREGVEQGKGLKLTEWDVGGQDWATRQTSALLSQKESLVGASRGSASLLPWLASGA